MAVRVLQYSDLENAYDRPERIGRVAGLIRSLRDPDALLVGTGDNTAPGVLSLRTEGRHALEFFETVRPDVATVGNHDFDYGPAALERIVAASPQTWIGTNLHLGPADWGSSTASTSEDAARIQGVAIREVAGTHVGLIGLIDPATPGDTPTAEDLAVTDPVETARKASAALRSWGVDQVIALAHLDGLDRLAGTPGIDAILAGHVHTPRLDRVDGTPIARPGANGAAVVELVLEDGRWSARRHEVAAGPVAESVAERFAELRAETDVAEAACTLEAPVRRDDEVVYAGPCRIGATIAEAYRWWLGADVGLQNSGGIRSGPALSGAVSAGELISLVPFEEPVALFELTGDELGTLLSERNGDRIAGAPADRHMGHVSAVGTDTESGSRSAAIDPEGTYELATSEYLCHAESEFPTLTGREPAAVSDLPQYEVLLAYVREHGISEFDQPAEPLRPESR